MTTQQFISPRRVRLQHTDSYGNVEFLVVEDGSVKLLSRDGMQMALANAFKSVEVVFELKDLPQDCPDLEERMLHVVRKYAKYQSSRWEVWNPES